MNRRLSATAVSKTAPKINIAQAYLQLQRFRQLVQEAERSLVVRERPIIHRAPALRKRRRWVEISDGSALHT
jgi:hypothetical protein